MLTYSDGIDKLFIVVGAGGDNPTPGNVILFHQDDAGMSQCLFEAGNVSYTLVGRTTNESIRRVGVTLYTQVVRAGARARAGAAARGR